MEVGDEYVVDLAPFHFVACQLHLGTFAAVDQEQMFIQCYHLGGRVSLIGRESGIIAEYGNAEHV